MPFPLPRHAYSRTAALDRHRPRQHRHLRRRVAGRARHLLEPDRDAGRGAAAARLPRRRHARRRGRAGRHRLRQLPRSPTSSASVALAVILFDGGLRTRLSVFRGVLGPSMALATAGVLVTATITGAAAYALIDFAPAEALLLGSIVASTDAAAVFFLLRTGGLRLQSRVGSTLEIEFEHQRSRRHAPRRDPAPSSSSRATAPSPGSVAGIVARGDRLRRRARRRRRLRPRRRAQQHPDAGRPASAVRGGERDPRSTGSPRCSAAAGCSRSSSPGSSSRTGRRGPIPRSSASTTRRPGSARS